MEQIMRIRSFFVFIRSELAKSGEMCYNTVVEIFKDEKKMWRTMMRKKEIVSMLAAAMVCLTFAGCGSSTGADAASRKAESPQATETAQTAEVPQTVETTQAADAARATEEQAEGEVDVVLDAGIDKYEGSWHEEIAGRGSMDISPSGDGKYYIEVYWGGSVEEMDVWKFTAIYDSATGDLSYDDGSYQSLLFDENGDETVQDEKSVHGVLHLVSDNKLEWTDSAYDSSEPSVFVKE